MFYCEKCHSLSQNQECGCCGFNQLREVKDDDFCYLTTTNEDFGKMFVEYLSNEGINCVSVPYGDGVRSQMALSLGKYKLYVPYKFYNNACEILEFFNENYSTNKVKEKILENQHKWNIENPKIEKKMRKKFKLNQDDNLLNFVKEKVEQADSVTDVGLMVDGEHGLLVKSGKIVIWFSSETFKINI
ncbi:MAG: hypothetical protein IKB30_03195 [Clostridia bacterium]|nr:hypothetical protein [Clostridia bacterium]